MENIKAVLAIPLFLTASIAVMTFLVDQERIDTMLYDIGEKPGRGMYQCINCTWRVRLDDDSDRLPPCGRCGPGQRTKYRKIA